MSNVVLYVLLLGIAIALVTLGHTRIATRLVDVAAAVLVLDLLADGAYVLVVIFVVLFATESYFNVVERGYEWLCKRRVLGVGEGSG